MEELKKLKSEFCLEFFCVSLFYFKIKKKKKKKKVFIFKQKIN